MYHIRTHTTHITQNTTQMFPICDPNGLGLPNEGTAVEMTWLTCLFAGVTALVHFSLFFSGQYAWDEFYERLKMPIGTSTIPYLFLIGSFIALPAQILLRIFALDRICGDYYDAIVILFLIDTLLNNLWICIFVVGIMRCQCAMVLYDQMRARTALIVIFLDMGVVATILILLIDAGDALTIIFCSVALAWRVIVTILNAIAGNKEAELCDMRGKNTISGAQAHAYSNL